MQKKKKGFSETCWKLYYTKARVLLIKEKKMPGIVHANPETGFSR